MNLQTAQTELKSRVPQVAPRMLAVEAIVVVSVSFMLVNIFA